MRYIIDIDGVISKKLTWTIGESYLRAKETFLDIEPNLEVIKKINHLHKNGNVIILFTGRLWHDYDVTVKWLNKHDVHYDQLIMAKPLGDYYIDDHNLSIDDFLKQEVKHGRPSNNQ